MDLTYAEIAWREGVRVCVVCQRGGVCVRGIRGAIEWTAGSSGIIHWRDRKVTKPGLRNFLVLVYETVHIGSGGSWKGEWDRLHRCNVYAYGRARASYGVILPRRLSRNDRALAYASMLTIHPKPQPAYQWAKEVIR